MAEFISRDLSSPLDLPPDLPENLAERDRILGEFEGFASDVPTTQGIMDFADGNPTTRANAVRAARLFSPAFLAGLGLATVDPMTTPDVTAPSANATFERRGLHDAALNVPGVGGPVLMWSFLARINRGADVNIEGWPASTIRVREGEIVHTLMNNRSGPHTIHHHGIEPTPANDGVGHLTFEVAGGDYTYQWQAGEAGTYFYHCHRNTVLHFEMGMYGMLIIDPDVPGAPFADGGPGETLVFGPGVTTVAAARTPYQAEAIWVADDVDARWRTLSVDEGIQDVDDDARSGFMTIGDPTNPRLHDFNPTYFVVSGQAAPAVDNGTNLIAGAGASVTFGQKLLVRTLNASYCTQVWKFPTSLQGTVIAQDGRSLGRPGFGSYSQPFSLASIGHQFVFTTARRWDILIDAGTATHIGQHLVEIEFRHWITNQLLRTVRVPINVVSPG